MTAPITRRKFLQMFSAAALCAIAPLPSLGYTNRHSYRSDVFGLSFNYPGAWHTLLPAERVESMKLVFGEEYAENKPVPAFQVTELLEPTKMLNPNFEFWASKREDWIEDDLVAVQREFYQEAAEVLPRFKITDCFRPVVFARKPASYCSYQFSDVQVAGPRLDWRAECYFVFHRDYLMMFNFKGGATDFTRLEDEFALIRSSVSFQ